MTTNQMSDKLNELKAGMKIRYIAGSKAGKVFEIISVENTPDAKYNRTTVVMLEAGKPETYTVNGVGLNAGKQIELSNVQVVTMYAQKPYMNWTIS